MNIHHFAGSAHAARRKRQGGRPDVRVGIHRPRPKVGGGPTNITRAVQRLRDARGQKKPGIFKRVVGAVKRWASKTESLDEAISAFRTLSEYGMAGSRAVGARTMFPVAHATPAALSKHQQEKLAKANESRARTRIRLQALAQEGLPERRPLKTLDS